MASSVHIAQAIEHTWLKADAQPEQVLGLCAEARSLGFHGVCVNPIYVAIARDALAGTNCKVVTVVAFPLGATIPSVAAREAETVVSHGANEVDMVIPIGLARAGELAAVRAAVTEVRQAIPETPLKVILETGFFDGDALRDLCHAVLEARPEFLKTCTGFGPRGATVEDVRTLTACAGDAARVKASGGIRTSADALAMLEAGASRLGTSSGAAIVGEDSDDSGTY